MMPQPFIKLWVNSFFRAFISIVGFITYLRLREWYIPIIQNMWLVGFFEGAGAIAIVNYYADKYGDSIQDIYLGLRELASQRRVRKNKKYNRK